jgi:predicted nucleic acid-binding protein
MRFVDTNILIRYLTRDDPQKAEAVQRLFQRLERGEEQARTTEAIITETCYVLASRTYNLSHEDIRQRLTPIINLRGLKLPHKRVYLRALDLYALHPRIDFEDVLSVAYMETEGITEIYSYDTDFDGIEGVGRVEP